MKKIMILGTGALAVYTLELAESMGENVVGYLSLRNNIDICGYKIHGKRVFSVDDIKEKDIKDYQLIVSIEDPLERKQSIELAKALGYNFGQLIHTSSKLPSNITLRDGVIIGRNVTMGDEVVVSPFSYILDDVNIGNYVFIDSYATIEKESFLEDYATVGKGEFVDNRKFDEMVS